MFRSKITISTKNINKMFQICKKMTISKKESKKDEKSINLLIYSIYVYLFVFLYLFLIIIAIEVYNQISNSNNNLIYDTVISLIKKFPYMIISNIMIFLIYIAVSEKDKIYYGDRHIVKYLTMNCIFQITIIICAL